MAEEPKPGSDLSRLSGLGFDLIAAVLGFTLAGYWLDGHFGTGPWGTLAGVFLGLIGGTYNMIRRSLLATRGPANEIKKTNGDGAP
jgi:F0F1-type ATP synthase assembly protein I